MSMDRRGFIRKGAFTVFSGCVVSSASLLAACAKKTGVGPFSAFSICQDSCVGCDDCTVVCAPGAIELPQRSLFSIAAEKCTDCGKCQEVCQPGAIRIAPQREYPLDPELCVGCGECIDVCEEDAISFGRDYYSVRGNCRPDLCQQECVAICPEQAISIVPAAGGEDESEEDRARAVIDLDLCTRCGKCVSACPRHSINPAHVKKDDSKCTNCGKCLDVCEFNAITVVEPEGYHVPILDPDLCTLCGACIPVCEENAIMAQMHTATIAQELCTACALCVDLCTYDAIKTTAI